MKTINLILVFIVVNIGFKAHSQALPEEEPTFSRGELLYENTLSDQDQIVDWIMEGPGRLEFREGWMEMYSPEEKFHHVFWCPEVFPDRFIAEWEAQNLETDAGLCIIFFAAKGLEGEDIFDASLPKRDGNFRGYTKGKINNYHISYYANNPGYEPGRGTANLRKNRGFDLVQTGLEGIPVVSEDMHKLRLVKDGRHIVMWVDDRRIIDWTDQAANAVQTHKDGKIGLRQMKWTHFRYRNFRVWSIED